MEVGREAHHALGVALVLGPEVRAGVPGGREHHPAERIDRHATPAPDPPALAAPAGHVPRGGALSAAGRDRDHPPVVGRVVADPGGRDVEDAVRQRQPAPDVLARGVSRDRPAPLGGAGGKVHVVRRAAPPLGDMGGGAALTRIDHIPGEERIARVSEPHRLGSL